MNPSDKHMAIKMCNAIGSQCMKMHERNGGNLLECFGPIAIKYFRDAAVFDLAGIVACVVHAIYPGKTSEEIQAIGAKPYMTDFAALVIAFGCTRRPVPDALPILESMHPDEDLSPIRKWIEDYEERTKDPLADFLRKRKENGNKAAEQ